MSPLPASPGRCWEASSVRHTCWAGTSTCRSFGKGGASAVRALEEDVAELLVETGAGVEGGQEVLFLQLVEHSVIMSDHGGIPRLPGDQRRLAEKVPGPQRRHLSRSGVALLQQHIDR